MSSSEWRIRRNGKPDLAFKGVQLGHTSQHALYRTDGGMLVLEVANYNLNHYAAYMGRTAEELLLNCGYHRAALDLLEEQGLTGPERID